MAGMDCVAPLVLALTDEAQVAPNGVVENAIAPLHSSFAGWVNAETGICKTRQADSDRVNSRIIGVGLRVNGFASGEGSKTGLNILIAGDLTPRILGAEISHGRFAADLFCHFGLGTIAKRFTGFAAISRIIIIFVFAAGYNDDKGGSQ